MTTKTSSALASIIVFSSLFSFSLARQLSQSYVPSTWINKCLSKCPDHPLDLCDFYFKDHLFDIPVFDLPSTIPTANFTISTPVYERILNRSIDIKLSRPACYLNNKQQYKFTGLHYGSSVNHIGYAFVNVTYQKMKDPCDEFCGKCVFLSVPQVRPHWADGSYTLLLSGDGNTVYPEDRRCVVYKTANCY